MFTSSLNNALSSANKEKIAGWCMPDYSAGIAPALVSGTKYTAEANIVINGYYSLRYNAYAYFRIYDSDDVELQSFTFLMGNQNEIRSIPFEFSIPKGYKYSLQFGGNSNINNVKIFPLIGG